MMNPFVLLGWIAGYIENFALRMAWCALALNARLVLKLDRNLPNPWVLEIRDTKRPVTDCRGREARATDYHDQLGVPLSRGDVFKLRSNGHDYPN